MVKHVGCQITSSAMEDLEQGLLDQTGPISVRPTPKCSTWTMLWLT